MAIPLTQVQDLKEHLLGVFERSAHHAGEVTEVVLTLYGAILWRMNPSDPIKVNTKEGTAGNVVWFRVDRTRYVLLYSHEERLIKLMESGRQGKVVHTFTNANSTKEVAQVFATLGEGVLDPESARKVRREDRDPNAPKDPQIKAARQLAKAAKAQKVPKDPAEKAEAKAARAAAKGSADGVAGEDSKGARLQAKAAKVLARDAKVKAQREKRKATRADDKASRLAAAEAAAQAAADEAAAEAAAESTAAPSA